MPRELCLASSWTISACGVVLSFCGALPACGEAFDGFSGPSQAERAHNSPSTTTRNHSESPTERVKVLRPGNSGKEVRLAAERLLAGTKLSAVQRRKVHSVLRETSYFRALPMLQFETDPRAYLYLTVQPEVTVSLWRAMGISKFELSPQRAGRYVADAGDGTKGTIEVLHQSPKRQIILCSGVFKSPLMLKGIKTRSIMHLQTDFSQQEDGRTVATHRAFVHVSFPSTAVETVAKMLSPVGNYILDKNFREISLFVHVMSLAMTRQPGWVEHITKKMDGISPKQKNDLLKLTARVYYAHRKRETIPLFKTRKEYRDEILKPLQRSSKSGTALRTSPDGSAR